MHFSMHALNANSFTKLNACEEKGYWHTYRRTVKAVKDKQNVGKQPAAALILTVTLHAARVEGSSPGAAAPVTRPRLHPSPAAPPPPTRARTRSATL